MTSILKKSLFLITVLRTFHKNMKDFTIYTDELNQPENFVCLFLLLVFLLACLFVFVCLFVCFLFVLLFIFFLRIINLFFNLVLRVTCILCLKYSR